MDEQEKVQIEPTEDVEWGDDVDLSDIFGETPEDDGDNQQPESEPEADQPKGEADGTDADVPAQQADEPAKTDTFELKHLDETRTVNREEVIALAQKGMDYDRIRAAWDEVKSLGDIETLREYKEFLEELSNGRPVTDTIDAIRASALEQQGVDHEVAMQRAKLERERRQFERERSKAKITADALAQQKQEADSKQQWRDQCIQDFVKEFPNVQPADVPKPVWDALQRGETLVSAYRGHRLRELEKELAAKAQEADNAKRAVGSRNTAGKAKNPDDAIFEGFDD